MNGKLDWKGVGQFVAILVRIWTIIKRVVDDSKVGLEMLDWIVGQGETFFTEGLATLVDEYKKSLSLPALTPVSKTEYVIDFDSKPYCPDHLSVAPDKCQITNRVRGKRHLNSFGVSLLFIKTGQRGEQGIRGHDLKEKLEYVNVLGAQLLDFYLEHIDLFPECLKIRGNVTFWGTIYMDERGNRYVRCFTWHGTEWGETYRKLDRDWYERDPAAIMVNNRAKASKLSTPQL